MTGRFTKQPAVEAPALPTRHPAALLAALVAALSLVVTVSFRLQDTDFWQHLAVGKAIWQLREIPTRHLWSWPTYGALDVNASWGFRALVWPVWEVGGVWGLFLWRWATTLGAFTLLFAASRRLGAKGLAPLAVIVVLALTWRHRSQIRPETLVAVLLALQIWILETRRSGGPDRSLWLVPLAWVWANVHISYHLGMAMLGIHLVGDAAAARRKGRRAEARLDSGPLAHRGGPVEGPTPNRARLALVTAAAALISFVNPWGWRALWQPFEYFFFWRHEPIFQTIAELSPLFPQAWLGTVTAGLPAVLLLWPLLLLWRIRRDGLDLVELLVCLLYTTLTVSAVRFAGFYALAAAPYLSRDLDGWIRARRWPAWSARPAARAGLVAAFSLAVCLPEWRRPDLPIGVALREKVYPVRACDFMLEHDIGGRGFNQFYLGGYMLWRFWPDRDRLPFMDIHQSGTREERRRYVRVFTHRDGWAQLDGQYAFDYALLDASDPLSGDRSRDMLDQDTSFVMVFRDDAAALYVRRSERFAALVERFGYRVVPGGERLMGAFGRAAMDDPAIRDEARRELERQMATSPWNARALSLLANIELIDRRFDQARAHLERALEADPELEMGRERLGLIALWQNRPADAVRELERARKSGSGSGAIDAGLAQAYQAIGDIRKAKRFYRRALERDPGNRVLADSLIRLEALERK